MMEPDSAANNAFDMAAARFLYRRCQELGVRLVVLTRYAAYAAKATPPLPARPAPCPCRGRDEESAPSGCPPQVDRSIYDEIASAGSCIGWRLRNEQRTKLELLWARANATDDEGRQGLPARCTREWFLAQFCDAKGARRGAARKADDAIWDLVDGFFQYDIFVIIYSEIRIVYKLGRRLLPVRHGRAARVDPCVPPALLPPGVGAGGARHVPPRHRDFGRGERRRRRCPAPGPSPEASLRRPVGERRRRAARPRAGDARRLRRRDRLPDAIAPPLPLASDARDPADAAALGPRADRPQALLRHAALSVGPRRDGVQRHPRRGAS